MSSMLFWSMIKPLLWLLPIFIIIAILKSPMFKGWFGEKLVEKVANHKLSNDIYHDFQNVTLPTDNGTTQIDHIYVSEFGIFVVETKNYKGWIYGKIKDAKWTQNIYGKKHYFQNPLRQNYKHIKTLEHLFGLTSDNFHSVIVFTGDCELKSNFPPNICRLGNFTNYILSFNEPKLDKNQINQICQLLAENRLEDTFETRQHHIQNLKNQHRP